MLCFLWPVHFHGFSVSLWVPQGATRRHYKPQGTMAEPVSFRRTRRCCGGGQPPLRHVSKGQGDAWARQTGRQAPPPTAGLRVGNAPQRGPTSESGLALRAPAALGLLAPQSLADPQIPARPTGWNQDSTCWKSPQAQTLGVARGDEARLLTENSWRRSDPGWDSVRGSRVQTGQRFPAPTLLGQQQTAYF